MYGSEKRMSMIYPVLTDVQITQIPSAAEQIVYRALRDQLPEDWLVVHSLEFIMTHKLSESHMDREADFVIFAPDYGVLVVEVKGGGISFNKKTGEWNSIDRNNNLHAIKNPLRQAKDAKYAIRDHLRQNIKNKQLLLGHAALFPDHRTTDLSALDSPDSPVEILGSIESIKDIHTWIKNIYLYWSGKEKNFDPLDKTGVDIANRIYGKEVSLKPSLVVSLERDSTIQIELTNRQKEVLRQLRRSNRRIIEGGAGTGKTVLALDHAQQLASQGKSVLMLCFNQQLANVLREKTSDIPTIHATTYHDFCASRVKKVEEETGRNLLTEAKLKNPTEDVFTVLYPDALSESFKLSPIVYDAIIVDEGQDFRDEYWLPLEIMADENDAMFYIFQDTNQAIYTNAASLPVSGEPLTLYQNCRNTLAIHKLVYQFYDGIEMDEPTLLGDDVAVISLDSLKAQSDYIDKTINNLVIQDGLRHKDIAVVTIGDFKEAKRLLEQTKNSQMWGFQVFSPEKHVLIETAKRYKGLESKILFLWVLNPADADGKLLYVSLSRARLRLYVVGNESVRDLLQKK